MAAVVLSVTLAEIALGQGMSAWQRHADQVRLAAVRGIIDTDAAQWRDPSWQRRAGLALAALGVEAQLVRVVPGASGQAVYTTTGARAYLDTGASLTAPVSGGTARGRTVGAGTGQGGDAVTLARAVATNPARAFGIYPQKGVLRVGAEADVLIVDPSRQQPIAAIPPYSSVDYTIYEGLPGLYPRVVLSRGRILARDGVYVGPDAGGRFVSGAL